jgi:hypothetical protein
MFNNAVVSFLHRHKSSTTTILVRQKHQDNYGGVMTQHLLLFLDGTAMTTLE